MLRNIKLTGFKSIKDLGDSGLALNRINILIGENGAGKSNLVSFIELLNFMISAPDGLQIFIGKSGGASSLLHYGPKYSPQIHAALSFEAPRGINEYAASLTFAAQDTLIFTEERLTFSATKSASGKPFSMNLGAGHFETRLREAMLEPGAQGQTAKIIKTLLETTRVFHFHDTSAESRIKQTSYIGDGKFLKSDGGNLAARLYALKQSRPEYYQRIINTICQIAPFFGDFELGPSAANKNFISLEWKERGSDLVFGAHQLSDGSIRFTALATLLLQPPEDLPDVIVIDEPELGLHPVAISVLGSMVHAAAEHSQIIMTTQSPKLLDEFTADDIIVVTRPQDRQLHRWSSGFHRLETKQLEKWLEEYCLSDLWDRNVLGGKPST